MTGTSFQTAIEIYASDGNITSYLSPSERERFFVFNNAEIGKRYIFRTYGDYDVMAYLYDDSFNQISMDDDGAGDRNALLSIITTNMTEKYYLKIKGYNDPSENVTFSVSLREGVYVEPDPDPDPDEVIIKCEAIPIYGYGRRLPTISG